MDYSALPLPKVNRHVQTKAMRDALRKRIDESESRKVRKRSEGRCELLIGISNTRCPWMASHVHHKMMGRGVRGRGASALAENKLHVCEPCHRAIHAKKLVECADGTWVRR